MLLHVMEGVLGDIGHTKVMMLPDLKEKGNREFAVVGSRG